MKRLAQENSLDLPVINSAISLLPGINALIPGAALLPIFAHKSSFKEAKGIGLIYSYTD